MSSRQLFVVIVLALVGIVGSNSIFVVNEGELAVKFRLGEVVESNYEPGLYFKTPFINNVKFFEKRILNLDVQATEYIVANKEKLLVDFYAKWKIIDVRDFYTSMSGGNINIANERLFNIINDGLKGKFSQYPVNNLVSGKHIDATGKLLSDKDIRGTIMSDLISEANFEAQKYGIEIVDIRIKRIDFSSTISQSVYKDMRTERGVEATEHRSKGKEESEKIRAEADRQRTVILSEAYRQSQDLRGKGDAEATQIYANAYNKDPEFYTFYRSLTAYKNTFNSSNDMLVIDPNSDFFNYFKEVRPRK